MILWFNRRNSQGAVSISIGFEKLIRLGKLIKSKLVLDKKFSKEMQAPLSPQIFVPYPK